MEGLWHWSLADRRRIGDCRGLGGTWWWAAGWWVGAVGGPGSWRLGWSGAKGIRARHGVGWRCPAGTASDWPEGEVVHG